MSQPFYKKMIAEVSEHTQNELPVGKSDVKSFTQINKEGFTPISKL